MGKVVSDLVSFVVAGLHISSLLFAYQILKVIVGSVFFGGHILSFVAMDNDVLILKSHAVYCKAD